jgi:protein TonB
MSVLRGAGTALAIAMIVPGIAAAEGAKDVWIKSLSVKLTAQRRYPPEATGQGGTARVVFRIDRSGRLLSAAIAESEGDPALDKEALAIVERAQPFASPPPDIGEDALTLRVPFVFPPRPKSSIIEDIGPDDAALKARLKGVCRGC